MKTARLLKIGRPNSDSNAGEEGFLIKHMKLQHKIGFNYETVPSTVYNQS